MTDSTGPFPRSWVIATAKIAEYLLNQNHTRGASKAKFFMAFGFHPDRLEELANALAGHRYAPGSQPDDPAQAGSTKIVFEGPIVSPDGRNPHVRTVWRVDSEGIARFITAIPLTGDWS